MDADPIIRPAVEADLDAIDRIYNHEVVHGVATWELDEWMPERRLAWFRARGDEEPVFVAEVEGEVVGFAYLSRYRERPGYRFTRENTLFIAPAFQRQGIGRRLMRALLDAGQQMGLRSLLAFIDDSNVASIELHRAFGYTQVGAEFETGYKLGAWRSTVEMQYLFERPEA